MNRMSASVLVLAVVAGQIQWLSGADPDSTNAPAFYPWSETSAFVRVPKSFLDEVNIFSVTITNHETMEYVISDDFIQAFALTDAQVGQLTTAINHAVDEWRVEKARHLVPTDDPVDMGRTHKKIVEKFTFRLEPSVEQRSAILTKLEGKVLSILGKERSERFWRYGGMLDSNEVQGFGPKSSPPAGMTTKTFYTFALQEGDAGPEISLYHNTVTSGRGGSGGGISAGPLPSNFDRFAPESMKPVLGRWRKVIEGTAQAASTEKKEKPSVQASSEQGAIQERTWQDGAPYVDLPKRLIKSFQIAGLTVDDEVSPEARALFGLSDSETKAVDGLYAEMRQRFEQVEVSHLERTKPTEYHFVLRAFPEQAKALQSEWLQKLSQTVGTRRAELLDGAIRTPIQPHFMRRGVRDHGDFIRMRQKGPSWLTRGMVDTQIDLTVDKGADGQPVIEKMDWSVGGEGGERGNIGVAPGAGGMKKLPERWRHLITPDILTMPSVL